MTENRKRVSVTVTGQQRSVTIRSLQRRRLVDVLWPAEETKTNAAVECWEHLRADK